MRFTMLPFLPAGLARAPRTWVLAIAVGGVLGAGQAAAAPAAQHDHAAQTPRTLEIKN